jgi:two-component system chemotaxis response regulator CheB
LEALSCGATDYIAKPAASAPGGAMAYLEAELVPRLELFGGNRAAKPEYQAPPARAERRRRDSIHCVAIGVSAGGPRALEALLPKLPASLPASVLIAQHMPSLFLNQMAERLRSQCELPVSVAQNGQLVEPAAVLFAPGEHHLRIVRTERQTRAAVDGGPAVNSCRPSANVLLQSVAEVYGQHALAIILTGMGDDGVDGCEAIQRHGGEVFVQDPETSLVWGMPGHVSKAGYADRVIALDQMAAAIVARVKLA